MIVPLRRWFDRLKFLVVFAVLTYTLYHLFGYVTAWIEPHKYREPGGHAVKVFQQQAVPGYENDSAVDRLRMFYWIGE